MNHISRRIKTKREPLDLIEREVAEKVLIKQQSYQAIKSAQTKKPRNLYELSITLNCEIAWLLSEKKKINNVEILSHQIPLIIYLQAAMLREIWEFQGSTGFDYIMTSLALSGKHLR